MSDGADIRDLAFAAVSTAFGSLGRFCMALDSSFRVRHVTARLDELLGPGAADQTRGLPAESILGAELFGPGAALRAALENGERREGWRGTLHLAGGAQRLVSLSAAPLIDDASGVCDPGTGDLTRAVSG